MFLMQWTLGIRDMEIVQIVLNEKFGFLHIKSYEDIYNHIQCALALLLASPLAENSGGAGALIVLQ